MEPLDSANLRMTIELADETATAALARALSGRTRPGDIIALSGELGAGKTSFARAFINALPRAIEDPDAQEPAPEEVPSPTFTLVQLYERAPATVWHFDLYRLEQAEEAYELGIEEAFAEGICLIEWPERLGGLLPVSCLELNLGFGTGSETRLASLSGSAEWKQRVGDLAPGTGVQPR